MRILVTGGAGYIGSHTCVELLESGHKVSVVDSLVNSRYEAITRVEELTGKRIDFYRADLRDHDSIDAIFQANRFEAVIHFAGLKAPGESVVKPLEYHHNNLVGTLELCKVMRSHKIKKVVFSSSATVYGEPQTVPIREDVGLSVLNPYGRTKLIIEEILQDIASADPEWHIVLLRYFNPVGAHPSGRIGEDPAGIPNNLMPFIAQVAVGRRPELIIFGDDYNTPDGTCIRDYIHVVDLADGHLKALEYLETKPGIVAFNLGTGKGYSVMDVVAAFGRAVGRPIPYKISKRRPGDAPVSFADPSMARKEMGWVARRGLDEMCQDVWRWQSANPLGYT